MLNDGWHEWVHGGWRFLAFLLGWWFEQIPDVTGYFSNVVIVRS